jgi:hypothetical protein
MGLGAGLDGSGKSRPNGGSDLDCQYYLIQIKGFYTSELKCVDIFVNIL